MQAVQAGRSRDAPVPSSLLRGLIRSGEAGRLRQASGISQATLAAGLRVSRRHLSRLENGTCQPGPVIAGRYLRVLRGLARHEAVSRQMAQRRAA